MSLERYSQHQTKLEVVGPRSYRGLQNLEISTAGFLFNPEELFDIVHEINLDRAQANWVRIEAYPMTDRMVFGALRNLAEKKGVSLPIPSTLSTGNTRALTDQYRRSQISRVHLPFSASLPEAIDKATFETSSARKIRSIAWILFFGPDRIREGFKIAREQMADINAHIDVAEGVLRKGLLGNFNFASSRMLVEDEDKPRSRKNSDQIEKAARISRENNLGGIVVGVEHLIDDNGNPIDLLRNQRVTDQARVLHIAKNGHGVLRVGDLENFFRQLGNTHFRMSVSGTLDYDPLQMKGLSTCEKFNLLRNTISWIESLQPTDN